MKRITRFVIAILLSITCLLSGCNLVVTDSARNLDRVAARLGDVTVSRKEVISLYNTYASNYLNSGYTQAQTLSTLAKSMINNKLLVKYAKDKYTSEPYNFAELVYKETDGNLNITHYNSVLNDVYDSVNSQLLSIENVIRTEQGLDIVSKDDTTNDDATPDYSPFVQYEKTVQRRWNTQTNSYDYYVEREEEVEDTELVGEFVQDIHGNYAVAKQAWARYIATLKNNEVGKNLTTNTNDVFEREVKRLFESYADQKYLDWLQEEFEKGLELDNQKILDMYKSLVEDSRAKYSTNYSSYFSKMQSSNGEVFYHPYEEDMGFVLVTHVLVKYTDEQIAQIADWKNDLAQGYINQEQYDEFFDNLKLTATAKTRDEEGFETGEEVSLAQIYAEIKGELDAVGTDLTKRAEVFNNFIYKYGQDDGVNNATSYYAVNMYKDGSTYTDTMVENFANESRRLILEEGEGSMSEPIFVESSNYAGFHIIFCVGYAHNLIAYENIKNITVDKLYETRVMAGVDKSYYDLMYEKVVQDSFSDYRTSLIKTLQNGRDMQIVTTAMQDLISDDSKFQ